MSGPNLRRRALLSGSVLAIAAAVGAATTTAAAAYAAYLTDGTAPPAADTELIRSCAAVIALEEEWKASAVDGELPDEMPGNYDELVAWLTNTPAQTDAGNRAKLAVAVSYFGGDPPDSGTVMTGILWDAVQALARLPASLSAEGSA